MAQSFRSFLFSLGILSLIALSNAVEWRRRNKLSPTLAREVEEIVAKRFRLHYCQYCHESFQLADELVQHWLRWKGKCNAPNAAPNDSEMNQPS